MANRILYVSSQVAPFTDGTTTAEISRHLPEKIQAGGSFDVRIMMPRYGTISERRNRLHEVIRLSGTDVPMGGDTSTLDVKVASIPDVRLQVYFMDNGAYFKRKGVYGDESGTFDDNVQRALFFGRSVMKTLRKLRWAPDIIHAIGAISSFTPFVLRNEFAEDELFAHTKVLYTPEAVDFNALLTAELAETFDLDLEESVRGAALNNLGLHYADAVIYPPDVQPAPGTAQFKDDYEGMAKQALDLYEQITNEVPA